MKAISELNLPLNVVGLCGLTENMYLFLGTYLSDSLSCTNNNILSLTFHFIFNQRPGGKAFKPEDVITSKKGLTVEIGNTDAEGRLVLADCLTYGQEKYQPTYIMDVATLVTLKF